MYQETCDAIHEIDADMICSIGPAKYYNLCNLNETMILNNTDKVIYNFNFFIPKPYVKVGMVNYTIDWPGKIKCCDLTTKCAPGHCEQNNCDHYIDVNKEWLNETMLIPLSDFRDKYNKPVLIDQWGVYYNAPNKTGYDNDMLSLMEYYDISWTNWLWRTYGTDNYGFEHNETNGSYFTDIDQVKTFQQFIN